ncbi:MAG: cytochrome c [Bacteroidota bacterium]|nr:cytochrome c [Bacteroidota bacterium]
MAISFFSYSLVLYSNKNYTYQSNYDHTKAIDGQLVWQKYNCQSCHQLYGLGGYLGPDLTNIISVKGKDKQYILAIIQSGSKQMPVFHLNEQEKENLITFLISTDASGTADPRTYIKQSNGMIYKHGN